MRGQWSNEEGKQTNEYPPPPVARLPACAATALVPRQFQVACLHNVAACLQREKLNPTPPPVTRLPACAAAALVPHKFQVVCLHDLAVCLRRLKARATIEIARLVCFLLNDGAAPLELPDPLPHKLQVNVPPKRVSS